MVRKEGSGFASALHLHSHSSHTSIFTHHSKVPSGLSRATNEDFDAAPSGAVMTPHDGSASSNSLSSGTPPPGDDVSTILADELGNALWTGVGVWIGVGIKIYVGE